MWSAWTARSPWPRRSRAWRSSLRELLEVLCGAPRSGSAPCSSMRWVCRAAVLVPPLLARHDESGLFKDPEMPHDAEPGQLRNLGLQLSERHAVALKEPIQEQPSSGVGQSLEHQVLVVHTRDDR